MTDQRHILLLGADGFIGRHVAYAARAAGHRVTCIARRTSALKALGFETFAADLTAEKWHSASSWRDLARTADGVINCAGLLTGSPAALAAVHEHAPAALYDALPHGSFLTLLSATGIDADTPFAEARRTGELTARLAAETGHHRLTILRAGLVLGDGAYGGSAVLRALSAFPFVMPVLGSGRHQFNPCHAEDLAQRLLAATGEAGSPRAIPTGGADTLTLKQLTAATRAHLGLRPVPALPVPMALARLMGRLGDAMRAGPFSTTAIAQLEHGVLAPTATPLPGASAFLARRPPTPADLWHARLYLLRPLLRLTLVLLWLVSGLLGLLTPPQSYLPDLAATGLSEQTLTTAARAFGVIDLALAAALFRNWRPRLTFWAQILLVTGYTAGLTMAAPHLWLDPYGALLKNLPILALLLTARALDTER
ncbi:SDR family oxidoreductase [Vannielia litorea]|uniref:Nucleoside-diphosphate-sugar epimerase n=1 Tax=Vannielia litorea TaxID=1217970 RepID=A0A1N6EBL8_9RHOB|nr:SDR family oxidoreductase [Vannielia litorea]SIN80428.1 Nucleoside-diphosphate-sugar epimerase [Vannielia litorea]